MSNKNVLIIGFIWPEPTSTAMGKRMLQLIHLFLADGYRVTFASSAMKSEFSFDLQNIGVEEVDIQLNDSGFDTFINELNPGIVLFDRFMAEEQYGWRIYENCPGALTILDTEDLHFLRKAREKQVKSGGELDLYSEIAKREIASILRCDISLIIASVEVELLKNEFNIDPDILYLLPFLEESISEQQVKNWKTYEERNDFVFIGNFLHEPNWHTVQYLKKNIWPGLRKLLPKAKLNIYGAYVSQKALQLHNEKERFLVHGRAKDALEVISENRALLAPIQIGAGIKGKFIDAMRAGTPSVTTGTGAESMHENNVWSGLIASNDEEFIRSAYLLYTDKNLWQKAQQNGIYLLNNYFNREKLSEKFITRLNQVQSNCTNHRKKNFMGEILKLNTVNSLKYMSLWIEEKNRL